MARRIALLIFLVPVCGRAASPDLRSPDSTICSFYLGDGTPEELRESVLKYYEQLIQEFRARLGDETQFLAWTDEALRDGKYFSPPVVGGGGVLWDYLSRLEKIALQQELPPSIRKQLESLREIAKKRVREGSKAVRKTREVSPVSRELPFPGSIRDFSRRSVLYKENDLPYKVFDIQTGVERVIDFPSGPFGMGGGAEWDADLREMLTVTPQAGVLDARLWDLSTGKYVKLPLPKELLETWSGSGDPFYITFNSDWKTRRVLAQIRLKDPKRNLGFIFEMGSDRLIAQFEKTAEFLVRKGDFNGATLEAVGYNFGAETHFYADLKNGRFAEMVRGTAGKVEHYQVDWGQRKAYVAIGESIQVFDLSSELLGGRKLLSTKGKVSPIVVDGGLGRGIYGSHTEVALFDLASGSKIRDYAIPRGKEVREIKVDAKFETAIIGFRKEGMAIWNLKTGENRYFGALSFEAVSPAFDKLIASGPQRKFLLLDLNRMVQDSY